MKRTTVALLSVVLVFGGGQATFASTAVDDEREPIEIVESYDGPATLTESAPASDAVPVPSAGWTGVPKGAGAAIDCLICGDVPRRYTQKVSGPVLVKKKFVRYLTGAWAKSTGYAWSATTTVGATLSSNIGVSAASVSSSIGATASVSRSYSITVNIAASSSRYSKLGLASNFNRYYVRSGIGIDSAADVKSWKYSHLYSPTRDQYLVVYYQ